MYWLRISCQYGLKEYHIPKRLISSRIMVSQPQGWLLTHQLMLLLSKNANSNMKLYLDMLPHSPCTPINGLTSSPMEKAYSLTSSQPFLASFPYETGESRRILEERCFWEPNLCPFLFPPHFPSLGHWSSNFCSHISAKMILKNLSHIFNLTSKNYHIISYRISLAENIIASIL